jgi:hypothetical protein
MSSNPVPSSGESSANQINHRPKRRRPPSPQLPDPSQRSRHSHAKYPRYRHRPLATLRNMQATLSCPPSIESPPTVAGSHHPLAGQSIGTKIVWRGLSLDDLAMWPLPAVSSTRTISPAPMWRVSPSLRGDRDPTRQADHILAARRSVPAVLVVCGGFAEQNAGRRQAFRHLAGGRLLDPVMRRRRSAPP